MLTILPTEVTNNIFIVDRNVDFARFNEQVIQGELT